MAAGALLACCAGSVAAANDLWGTVHEVLAHPVDAHTVGKAFGTTLVQTVDKPGEARYEGTGPSFADGTRVDTVSLTRFAGDGSSVVGASLSGRCIGADDIERAFAHTELMSLPTHGYPDAVATYTWKAPAGRVSFYVNFRTRCLSSLKIEAR